MDRWSLQFLLQFFNRFHSLFNHLSCQFLHYFLIPMHIFFFPFRVYAYPHMQRDVRQRLISREQIERRRKQKISAREREREPLNISNFLRFNYLLVWFIDSTLCGCHRHFIKRVLRSSRPWLTGSRII